MAKINLPEKDAFAGEEIGDYKLCKEIGRGKIGVVYKAQNLNSKIDDTVACKIIPKENLKDGWETEIKKTAKLDGIPTVAQYKGRYDERQIKGLKYICIFYEYIGDEDKSAINLRDLGLTQNIHKFKDFKTFLRVGLRKS